MMPFGFSARPVQIATCNFPPRSCDLFTLPPHAPCRLQRFLCRNFLFQPPLPPHAPCRLQLSRRRGVLTPTCFASTRSVQIATFLAHSLIPMLSPLPPHAPCRLQRSLPCSTHRSLALPPHAPCRLQQARGRNLCR